MFPDHLPNHVLKQSAEGEITSKEFATKYDSQLLRSVESIGHVLHSENVKPAEKKQASGILPTLWKKLKGKSNKGHNR